MQAADEGYGGGFKSLGAMAKSPYTIEAVEDARRVASKERYRELNHSQARGETEEEHKAVVAVWKTLPGYTCYMDALAITARM